MNPTVLAPAQLSTAQLSTAQLSTAQLSTAQLSPTLLPRARGLTDLLIAPGGPGVTPDAAAALRRRLDDALAAPVAGLAGGRPIRVDTYLLRTMLRSPDRQLKEDPFRWSPRTAKRSIGLAAVRDCIDGRAHTPSEGVAMATAQLVADAQEGRARSGSLGRWLAVVPEGGRAAVRAEATTWATRLYEAVDWDQLDRPPVVGGHDKWWDCSGTPPVGLRGRTDVQVLTSFGHTAEPGSCAPGGAAGDRPPAFFTMIGGRPGPTSRIELGLAALVTVLARPLAPTPARVVGWWPDCGRALALPVDLSLLQQTAAAVVTAVRAAAAVTATAG